jgi:hypothetical protein
LAATLTGANSHDVTQLDPLVEAIPPVRGNGAALVADPIAFKATVRTTRSRIARDSASEALRLCSPSETPNMEVDWASIVGWSNEP